MLIARNVLGASISQVSCKHTVHSLLQMIGLMNGLISSAVLHKQTSH